MIRVVDVHTYIHMFTFLLLTLIIFVIVYFPIVNNTPIPLIRVVDVHTYICLPSSC